jgi:hypothetical protein
LNASPFKSFLVSRAELDIMNQLLQANQNLTGFRIYMGTLGTSDRVEILGINPDGHRNLTVIYETTRTGSGPCPIICDLPDQNQ